MICNDWIGGGLPTDKDILCRMFRCDEQVLNNCLTPFNSVGGVLRHKRIMKELSKQEEYRKKKSIAGKASADARKRLAMQRDNASDTRLTPVKKCSNTNSTESNSNNLPTWTYAMIFKNIRFQNSCRVHYVKRKLF